MCEPHIFTIPDWGCLLSEQVKLVGMRGFWEVIPMRWVLAVVCNRERPIAAFASQLMYSGSLRPQPVQRISSSVIP